ncbi:MAG: hypothetical protein KJ072_03650 [Verrucomicrobia bacterium]|nr:hypothetical protein [Verrucomicrobiota bacterium]
MTPTPAAVVPSPSRPGGGRAAELALVIVFLLLLAGGILIQTAVELRRGDGVSALEVFHRKPTSANLRAYEHRLEEASVVARALRPLFQFVQFTWLRDGGEKALVGRDGWLFYKPGLDDMVTRGGGLATATNDPVAAIVAWRDALAARGIHLLVVLAPNKESVYPDRLTRRFAEGQTVRSPTTRDLIARLRSANVHCVDLFALFAEARTNTATSSPAPLYLQQDSHWSPAGVALAAQAVARRLVELGWAKPGAVAYRERAAPVERLGDVLQMLRSTPIERSSVPEKIRCVQVLRDHSGQPYQDDPQSEILILGDSFLRLYQQDEPGSAGFVAHLAKELRQPLTSLVNDGGASTLVRQELHRRPALLRHKRVVVWEFVERDIRLGTEGWQQVPLPPLASAEVGDRQRKPARSQENPSRPTRAIAGE